MSGVEEALFEMSEPYCPHLGNPDNSLRNHVTLIGLNFPSPFVLFVPFDFLSFLASG
jgi:hypothetical protein